MNNLEKKLKQYINSHLSKAANIAFSKNGLVYFTELGAEETVKKMRLDLFSEPETFVSLPEWISPVDNTEPRAEGLRIDINGRVTYCRVWHRKTSADDPRCTKA